MYISRALSFREIKYMQIFGIAYHHEFICIEYQHFHDMIYNILAVM